MTYDGATGQSRSRGPYAWTRPAQEAFVLCDGAISYGRCMSCFQIVQTTGGRHYTKVVVQEGT